VEIDLIVRGMCALRPGVRGVSDNIRVRSIVGRFLEHSRIFYFANAGQEEYFLGSADWMPRNLYERVELMFPVRDSQLRQRLRQEILDPYLADTEKARRLRADGSYHRPGRGPRRAGTRRATASFNAQAFLIGLAEGKNVFEETLTPHKSKPIVEAV
jgi:polyphosphate kinase